MVMCAQFHDICFGGAPHGGHLEPAKLEKVFPMFELRFADVRPLHAPLVPVSFLHCGKEGCMCARLPCPCPSEKEVRQLMEPKPDQGQCLTCSLAKKGLCCCLRRT